MEENKPTHDAGVEQPDGEAQSADEFEAHLLKQLADSGGVDKETLWELCRFYSLTQRHPVARTYLERLLKMPCELEERARYIFALGQGGRRLILRNHGNDDERCGRDSRWSALAPVVLPGERSRERAVAGR